MYHHSKNTVDNPIPNGINDQLEYPYVIPVHPTYLRFPDGKFEGAVVINALTGFHSTPVTTLGKCLLVFFVDFLQILALCIRVY